MAGWWENCITTTFIESNNLKQNDCQFFLSTILFCFFDFFHLTQQHLWYPLLTRRYSHWIIQLLFVFSPHHVESPTLPPSPFSTAGDVGDDSPVAALHFIAPLSYSCKCWCFLLLTAHKSPRSYKLQLHRFGSLTRWWDFSSFFIFLFLSFPFLETQKPLAFALQTTFRRSTTHIFSWC